MSKLTPRQLEMLSQIADGLSNHQIGNVHGLSRWTVQDEIAVIRHTLAARDRANAVAVGFRTGLIPHDYFAADLQVGAA